MKVVMIMRSQSGVPGGAGVPGGQIGTIQLARALAADGFDVELFVGGPRMAYLAGLDDIPVRYLRWPVWLDTMIRAGSPRLRAVGRDLRRRRWLRAVTALPEVRSADVIHVQGLEDAEALLTRFTGPVVVTHWGRAGRWLPRTNGASDGDGDGALRSRIERIRADVTLVAIGHAQAADLASAGMPAAAVIPPGLDLRHFTPGDRAQARRELGLPADGGIVLCVSRLASDKNVETLVRAFARLDPARGAARLVIVGDGPARTNLVGLIASLGVTASTTILPLVAHHLLAGYYRAADVTVVPSDYLETFSMAALEAIACGCPLIVTDQVPEILRAFPDVPSVAPHDVTALSGRITDALDGALAPADNTRAGDYDWTAIARRYADLYRTALRTGRSHS